MAQRVPFLEPLLPHVHVPLSRLFPAVADKLWVSELAIMSAALALVTVLMPVVTRRPVVSFFVTTALAVYANMVFWMHPEREFTMEWLGAPCNDEVLVVVVLAGAYMIGHSIEFLVWPTETVPYRLMYTAHHWPVALSCVSVLLYRRWGHMLLLGLTAEISNVLLNGKDVVPMSAHAAALCQYVWVAMFLGYRMMFVFVYACLAVAHLAARREWFELLVTNLGVIVVILLHIWWSYLILAALTALMRGKQPEDGLKKEL
eukprot:TRINITY_DN1892_c0_g1_i1.p1 TRINITY_DN1892_c0_g1~~TRINITY_DN1892_c0_g1_i1.p1  ORF type:complete len:259 (+),score=115.45 TRINITY_DN1892_c0_g1_i1:143-919(+)